MRYITDSDIRQKIKKTIQLYVSYGLRITYILSRLNISKRQYYYLLEHKQSQEHYKPSYSYTKITQEEEKKVIDYVKKHTELYHRELSYMMLDENIVSMSESGNVIDTYIAF
jgi:hypothetical protein